MPDFDIDFFARNRRGEVIDYVQQRLRPRPGGADHQPSARLQAEGGGLRDVGRVLQMPYGQVDKLTKLVPQNPAAPVTLAAAIASEPKLQAFFATRIRVVGASLPNIAQAGWRGLTRHASTHARRDRDRRTGRSASSCRSTAIRSRNMPRHPVQHENGSNPRASSNSTSSASRRWTVLDVAV